jgi:RHS repeat-associated protein
MGGKLIAEYRDGTTYFRHDDHLGTARVLTMMNQAIHDSADYQPFGEQSSGDTGTTHKFTGKERDGETLLDDFGARYYSSTMGRFMTPDWAARPVSVPYAVFGDPQSLNLYGYVRNDPVSRADADGHDPGGPMGLSQIGAQSDADAEDFHSRYYGLHHDSTSPTQGKLKGQNIDSNQVAGVRKLDPNSQECKDLAKKIDNIATDIKHRDGEIASNPLNLPETAPPGSPPRASVEGHRGLVKDLIDTLGAAADLYNNKCGGGPPPPLSPVGDTSHAPSGAPSSVSPKEIVGVLVLGAAIALAPETGGLSLAFAF